jgi:hypothetical protein
VSKWVAYHGGARPAPGEHYIEVEMRNGALRVDAARHFTWEDHCYRPTDIMRWRFYEPEAIRLPVPVVTQSRRGSFIEACINVLIGWTINFCANLLIFPLFGWSITLGQNVMLGSIFTVIAVTRSYLIRRYFNARLTALAQRLAGA